MQSLFFFWKKERGMKPRVLFQCLFIPLVAVFILLVISQEHAPIAHAHFVPYVSAASVPQPYMEYQIYGGSIITDTTMPPVLPGGQADYAEIYTEHDLCALIASGAVDEIWIWTGNGDGITKGHMWEWTASGAEWHGDAPDCGKVVTTMAFNYLLGVDLALESYNHRAETFFSHYFICDFATATWPWAGSTTWPYSECGSLLSDRYGFVARPFDGNDYIGGCGDAHDPPNILTNDAYRYSDLTVVDTICPSWSEDGSAVPTSLDCQAWGCTHWGFHIWWMQNVPGLNNINKDRNGNPHPNWWPYLFGLPAAHVSTYMPMILSPSSRNAEIKAPSLPSLIREQKSGFATEPLLRELSDEDKPNGLESAVIHTPSALTGQPAVITHTVFVLYYPGYGGTPRADIQVLTKELIGLLKEATIYHGYQYGIPALRGTFLGQDGGSYAGQDCSAGTVADNIHIHLDGLRTDVQITGYSVSDPGGYWANPCNLGSSWLLYVTSATPEQADLYFKPCWAAPDDTFYVITVYYSDGTSQYTVVVGTPVQPK
jgi:hypothetical protein